MTDIIERLRSYRGPWLVPAEAADEIEKLRGEVAALKAAAEKGTEYVLAQINQDLRDDYAASRRYADELRAERDAARAERDAAVAALGMIAGIQPCPDNLMSDKEIAKAAIDAARGEK